ncbi:phosphoglycerate kinase [Eilatimonas milleporae]|uniref:Phosphoglycerate kinase n=1 Tax=Eilatimonas milleporae TaxID=911205 RepID=A0A3M0CH58_9PROT|nr:phosphoglycerate kinase [Eilatimonas milleporae]RMB07850.1 phosphoglycerate kinase [Eilatimonas milleporae]
MAFQTLADLGDLTGRRAVIRVDLNVPMADGRVTDDTRLRAVRPTVDAVLAAGGRAVLLAHFGRPKGKVVPEMSLAPVVPALAAVLDRDVAFATFDDALPDLDVVVMENTRFFPGEETNDTDLAKRFAALGDVYVNDAFSCAHRAHASTEGIARLLPAAAGVTMAAELAALEAALGTPERPVGAVVGGAKVSTKLAVLEHLVEKVDHLIIGGGMANTFLYAQGRDVGASLCEKDMADTARTILTKAQATGCTVHLPQDVVAASAFAEGAPHRVTGLGDVGAEELILDAGPETAEHLKRVIAACRTLVWNGPLGAFELKPFDAATVALAREAAALTISGALVSVAGGGDTVAALAAAGVRDAFSHISTAGGAFLEWMEGRTLPGVAALEHQADESSVA